MEPRSGLDLQKESVYLENLKRDLENQISSIDIQLSYEQKYVGAAKPILNRYHHTSTIVIDSLTSYNLKVLAERKTFVKTDPTYEDLISTGNIVLLENRKLRNSIIEYYQELERVEKVIQNNNTLLTDQRYGIEIAKSVYVGQVPSDHLFEVSNELLKDPEREMIFINQVDLRSNVANKHLKYMNELREKTITMIKLLEQSLQ